MLVYKEQQFYRFGVASRCALYSGRFRSSIDYRHYQKRPLNDPVSLFDNIHQRIHEAHDGRSVHSFRIDPWIFYKGITAKILKHKHQEGKGVFDLT
jgi:hypothetical protein